MAWAVGTALLLTAVLVVGDGDRTGSLLHTAGVWTIVLVVDAVVSLSYSLSPRKAPASDPPRGRRPLTPRGRQCREPTDSKLASWRILSLSPRALRSRRSSVGSAKSRLSWAATTGCTSA